MPRFSQRSLDRLSSCHPDLVTLFNIVICHFDCAVLCGHRNQATQDKLLSEGKTQLAYPHSKHNTLPSMAVDVAPSPIDWQDLRRWYLFGGYVLGTARQLYGDGQIEHLIRWGGDWDSDTEVADNKFNDLPHFELIKPDTHYLKAA